MLNEFLKSSTVDDLLESIIPDDIQQTVQFPNRGWPDDSYKLRTFEHLEFFPCTSEDHSSFPRASD
jgi:hypothetical protein